MKYLKLFVAVLVLTGFSAAEVFYDVEADSESLTIDSSVKLECTPEPEGSGCPVSRWRAELSVPNSAEINSVESHNGEVEEWSREGNTLTVQTSTPPTRSELIRANYVIERDAKQVTEDLYTRSISLPGFSGQQNSGTILIHDFISGRISPGFQYSIEGNEVNFTGTGATNFVAAFGNGDKTDYFEFFGGELDNSAKAYRIPVGTLGFSNRFDRFPVAVMDSETYNKTVNRWSAGQYANAAIYLREDLGKDELPILSHEAVHGLNEQAFEWETSSAWFDEGTAKHLEFLVTKSEKQRTREIFGEPVTYREEESGRTYRYTLPSKGDADQLWNYYQQDYEWMKHWTPEKGNRDFGYAYSELVIKNYIRNNNSLRELYTDLEDTSFESDDEKWRGISEHVDVTPCKYESRESFNQCLESVNSYDYPVYSATSIEKEQNTLVVEKLEVEGAESVEASEVVSTEKTVEAAETWLDRFLDFLQGFLNS